jgi:acylphosphatase
MFKYPIVDERIIKGLKFVLVSRSFPEEYDVFYCESLKAARVSFIDHLIIINHPDGKVENVYNAEPKRGVGEFYNEMDRYRHLNKAAKSIKKRIKKNNKLLTNMKDYLIKGIHFKSFAGANDEDYLIYVLESTQAYGFVEVNKGNVKGVSYNKNEIIYDEKIKGYDGFKDNKERRYHLTIIARRIKLYYIKKSLYAFFRYKFDW